MVPAALMGFDRAVDQGVGVEWPIFGATMRVVICGGGVIGACTAYFLSRRGIDVTVVERTEVAAAASGWLGMMGGRTRGGWS